MRTRALSIGCSDGVGVGSGHWHTYLIEEELVQQVPRRLLGVKALLVGFDHFRDRHIALRHDALHSMSASADQRKKYLLLSKLSKLSRGSPCSCIRMGAVRIHRVQLH